MRGGLLATTSTARSKRCHASGSNSISARGFLAMPKLPIETYEALALKLRTRFDFVESVMAMDAPLSTIVETTCLHGRKIIETIAYMGLVVTEHSIGKAHIPRDARDHWNAETIFIRLKKKGLNLLPSPSRITRAPGYQAAIEGIPECRLSYDQLIYKTFHKGLHEPNPYVQGDDDEFYKKLLPKLGTDLTRLRNFTWRHFISIKGSGFFVCLRDGEGAFGLIPLSKTANLPGSGRTLIANDI
jgi:hypothetical protein